jgi:hypothetical protein
MYSLSHTHVHNGLQSGKLESEEETSSNIAIQEILLALLWVQRYITNFNGDPKKVTLAGHSAAGTVFVCMYVRSYQCFLCICMNVCMYTCMFYSGESTYECKCKYVRIYICMYVL